MSKTERRLEWADQLTPLIDADSEMRSFIDNGERPQTSRLVRWRANIGTVLDAILKNGPEAPKWPEHNTLLAEHDRLREALRGVMPFVGVSHNCTALAPCKRCDRECEASAAARAALAKVQP